MNDIICPNCEKVFKVDEAGFADIVKQVRDHKFDEELNDRLSLAEKDKETAIELAQSKIENSFQKIIADKDKNLTDKLAKKEIEISAIKSKLEISDSEKKLAISEATKLVEKERDELINGLKNKDIERTLLEKSLNEKFAIEIRVKDDIIRMKDEEIVYRKDMKQKLSTKMIGETLEHHCESEFNKLRTTGFKTAYFEKDNDAKTGSKGDYVYRESDEDGNEFISIMFEMKNEGDETATKKKNEDFFKELNKDRNEKKCEYAVLVTLLEADSELYNAGIVDVSYKYEKMYVVRPQFFIPIISLLRNASKSSLEYKRELNLIRNQNIDITNFEDKMDSFKEGFSKNYISASKHFHQAIDEIDKSIARLQRVKQELTTSENQLRLANSKAEDLTIKKLTYNNSTMKSMFKEISNKD